MSISKHELKLLAKQNNISIGHIVNDIWKEKSKSQLQEEILNFNNNNLQGGSKASNYVKYLYSKDKFDITKIKKPSNNLINRNEIVNTKTEETKKILNNIQIYNIMLNDIANELNNYKKMYPQQKQKKNYVIQTLFE